MTHHLCTQKCVHITLLFKELCGVRFAHSMMCFHFLLDFITLQLGSVEAFKLGCISRCVIVSECFEVESLWEPNLVAEGLSHNFYVGCIRVFCFVDLHFI